MAPPRNSLPQYRSASPDAPKSVSPTRKRKRDILSCLECRRRKVKCDRSLPACDRCRRGGNAAACTYSYAGSSRDGEGALDDGRAESEEEGEEHRDEVPDDAHKRQRPSEWANSRGGSTAQDTSNGTSTSLLRQSKAMKTVEDRLADLESMFAGKQSVAGIRTEADETMISGPLRTLKKGGKFEWSKNRTEERETSFFKGPNGIRTQFYGPSMPTSVLAHLPEVRTFMKEAMPNSAILEVQNQHQFTEARLPRPPPDDIRDLVPAKDVTDHFVNLYLSTFETTFRILHVPSFLSDYDAFWVGKEDLTPGFVPLLLLVMASVRCISPEGTIGHSPDFVTARQDVLDWVLSCDDWLEKQSQKRRFLAMYQVGCLRMLTELTSCIKRKRAFQHAESLLNYFRAAGMHRDPKLLGGKCTTFEGEMRRRLWATVVELELQTCIDRGMASSLVGAQVDCPPPRNINDEDIALLKSELPTSRPSEEHTASSYLHLSSKSLQLRVLLSSLVNEPRTRISYDELLQYEQQIMDEINMLPKWANEKHVMTSTLLDVQLRQFLIMLHAPFTRRSPTTSQWRYSRTVCLDASTTLLEVHARLLDSSNFALCLLRHDAYRAALTICYDLLTRDLSQDTRFGAAMRVEALGLIEGGIKQLETRLLCAKIGFHELWYVSAAWGLLQSKLDPESKAMTHAAERIVKLYQRLMKDQERAGLLQTPEGIVGPVGASLKDDLLGNPLLPAATSTFSMGLFEDPFDNSYPNEIGDWTLENLWPYDLDADVMMP